MNLGLSPNPQALKFDMLVIGSRSSKLALWQADWVRRRICSLFPEEETKIEVIRTTGDRLADAPLAQIGGKGAFVKEIEEALLDGRIDLAVHSLKDVPSILPKGLRLGAIAERQDARDALVAKASIKGFVDLPPGATIGTSSLRRQCQLKHLRPDLKIVPIRGNVDTRLRKLREGQEIMAIVLASAGLIRLGLQGEITEMLPVDLIVPAIGQGAIAIEIRDGDARVERIVAELNHAPTETATRAERAFLRRLGGSCQIPLAAYAELSDGCLLIRGIVASIDGSKVIRERLTGSASDPESLGIALAEKMLDRGANELLSSLRA